MYSLDERSSALPGRKLRLAVAVLAAMLGVFMLASSSTALAAVPTLEPVVSAQPADPNTTSRSNSFSVSVDPAETETITQIQCRLDPTVATAWSYCLGPAGGPHNRADLSNGIHEIQFRTLNDDGAGPVKSITWTVNTPVPTLPPVVTVQPSNPNTTTTTNNFRQNIDPSQTAIAATMQCRLDGGAWANCGGNVNYYLGNGEHTFESRVFNAGGAGPIKTITWKNEVPETLGGAIHIDDVATTRWDGPSSGSALGANNLGSAGSLNIGDINGDGINDLGIGDQSSGDTQIIFNTANPLGAKDMKNLGPARGYRIVTGAFTPASLNIGDQNDDGVPDLLLASSGSDKVFVVYGVEDPSSLPPCETGSPVRCLDATAMSPGEGYEVTSSDDLSTLAAIGDFDGDGIDDLGFGSQEFAFIMKGGIDRSGSVSIQSRLGIDAFTITGPTGIGFGSFTNGIEDLDGDGKDEVGVLGGLMSGGGLIVITGRSFEGLSTIDTTTLNTSIGFLIATPPLGVPQATNIGDMNDDGRDDLMIGYISLASATAGLVSVVYMPALPTTDPILTGDDIETGDGYQFTPGGAPAGLGLSQTPVGDINSDGLSDQILGAPATTVNGFEKGGAAYLTFGRDAATVESPIELGPSYSPEDGVAIVSGKARNGQFGSSPSLLGDIDGDDLPDFAVGADGEANNGLTRSGSIYIVPGKSLMAKPTTAGSTVTSDKAAVINGQVATNGRGVEYRFEYGTTSGYGSTTSVESEPAGGTVPVSENLEGLNPNTVYHYRLVVTNDLGVTRSGGDRTFTTKATPPAEGCAADSTKPGCPDYDRCKADSTQPGCADYNYCKANPAKPECKAPEAKLSSLIAGTDSMTVKRGKKTTATATIVNAGTASASGLKICLSAPKKMVSGARCISVGNLGAGATATRKFKVTVKKKAKKGKKVALSFKATANGLGAKTGKVSIKVG